MARYMPWYNGQHKHSGIALFSPNQVHDGTWRQRWHRRDQTQQAYYKAHPERFRDAHEHQPPPKPSASTSPTLNDSRQLDNARIRHIP